MIEHDLDNTIPKHKLMEAEAERVLAYDEASFYNVQDSDYEQELDYEHLEFPCEGNDD